MYIIRVCNPILQLQKILPKYERKLKKMCWVNPLEVLDPDPRCSQQDADLLFPKWSRGETKVRALPGTSNSSLRKEGRTTTNKQGTANTLLFYLVKPEGMSSAGVNIWFFSPGVSLPNNLLVPADTMETTGAPSPAPCPNTSKFGSLHSSQSL